jgi:DNA-binding XRE family transcriptional regulator
MNRKVQIIERDGQPEYAVLPFPAYEEMKRLSEAMRDIQSYDAALTDSGESVPHSVMLRLMGDESPVKVWREYRGMAQAALAKQARIDKTYLSQIESGRKTGSVGVLRRLAVALSVDVDDLIPTADGE